MLGVGVWLGLVVGMVSRGIWGVTGFVSLAGMSIFLLLKGSVIYGCLSLVFRENWPTSLRVYTALQHGPFLSLAVTNPTTTTTTTTY